MCQKLFIQIYTQFCESYQVFLISLKSEMKYAKGQIQILIVALCLLATKYDAKANFASPHQDLKYYNATINIFSDTYNTKRCTRTQAGNALREFVACHAGPRLGSDVYLKRLYHPRETLFCVIIDVKLYLGLVRPKRI